ncbi:DUF1223 domain-containing protein [Paracoccus sp. (in: a-proteobacteria)]|uniref:DUF1223 domain-containing protein n=1 Tax=Paracoccus sp. TaxID=267 RepID=UPI003A89A0D4
MRSFPHIFGTTGRAGGSPLFMIAAALLLSAMAAAGQGAGQPDEWGDMPVIVAPTDPGRAAAAQLPLIPGDGGFNSFAATDLVSPPLGDVLPAITPVVIELFTSQGCSSCPPVDAMVASLAAEPGVLPLSFHVDYWDYLGWADSFAHPEFTARQAAYANAVGERALYTPQLIVNGLDTAVSPGPAQLMGLIDAHRLSPAMVAVHTDKSPDGSRIEVTPLSQLGGSVDLLLIRYAPQRKVRVLAGENRGREIHYTNIVLSVDHLADWDGGAPLRLTVRSDSALDDSFPDDTRHVLLVQQEIGRHGLPGPIFAAISLD